MMKHLRSYKDAIAATALARTGFIPRALGTAAAVCCTLLLTLPVSAQLQHRWSFTSDATDSIGSADWTLEGNANVTGGLLVLDGNTDAGLTRAIQDGSSIAINTYPAITLDPTSIFVSSSVC